MLIGVIQENTIEAVKAQLHALPDYFDAVELRLDACQGIDKNALSGMDFPKPVIITLRSKDQGGTYPHDEEQRLETLLDLARCQPDYIDLEYNVPSAWVKKIQACSPKTRIIISYHDFTKTPEDLGAILGKMKKTMAGAIYKIATMANSTLDALRMMVFCKESSDELIGICMGEAGATTRILAPVLHTGFSYCPVTTASAPGQIDPQFLCDVYNFKHLNKQTQIYGLLGDPVAPSQGHLLHNKANLAEGLNAVYVKWQVTPENLAEAVGLLKKLDVRGLSVTMPLKEHILPLLDELEEQVKKIGASNTIAVRDGEWIGCNTDARGALKALPYSLEGKKVVLLGAGGAAKAIFHEIKKQTQDILVLNRSVEKAAKFGVRALPLEALATLADEKYDCLINTLPASAELPMTSRTFLPEAVVMDITYTSESACLRKAREHGAQCIEGLAMFREQAALQRYLWKKSQEESGLALRNQKVA